MGRSGERKQAKQLPDEAVKVFSKFLYALSRRAGYEALGPIDCSIQRLARLIIDDTVEPTFIARFGVEGMKDKLWLTCLSFYTLALLRKDDRFSHEIEGKFNELVAEFGLEEVEADMVVVIDEEELA